MATEGLLAKTCVCLPELDVAIPATGEEEVFVWNELDSGDCVVVSLEGHLAGEFVHAPDFYGHVCGTGGKQLTLSIEIQSVNLFRMPRQRLLQFPRIKVPNFYNRILPSGSYKCIVRVKHNICYHSSMAFELCIATRSFRRKLVIEFFFAYLCFFHYGIAIYY